MVEEAWAKVALFFRTGEHFGHKPRSRRTQSLLRIHERINVYKTRFKAGDTLALLQAIALCAEENLPLPTWLATAYQTALTSFLQVGGPPTLDAVFNSPTLPTNTAKAAAAARQDWVLAVALYRRAWETVQANAAITSLDGLITAVLAAGKFGVAKTKARALILMVEKNQLQHLGYDQSKSLSRFLLKRRKP